MGLPLECAQRLNGRAGSTLLIPLNIYEACAILRSLAVLLTVHSWHMAEDMMVICFSADLESIADALKSIPNMPLRFNPAT